MDDWCEGCSSFVQPCCGKVALLQNTMTVTDRCFGHGATALEVSGQVSAELCQQPATN
jgi:hypothetical protein